MERRVQLSYLTEVPHVPHIETVITVHHRQLREERATILEWKHFGKFFLHRVYAIMHEINSNPIFNPAKIVNCFKGYSRNVLTLLLLKSSAVATMSGYFISSAGL